MLGIIGGSGFYKLGGREITIKTPFGDVSLFKAIIGNKRIAFLPRHGKFHKIPPFRINYRGNIYALKSVGVKAIISTSACGGINIPPGSIVITSDFIDFTSRVKTFFDGDFSITVDGVTLSGAIHVNMDPPFCPYLRSILLKAAEMENIHVVKKGVYAVMDGNKYETPAESRMLKTLGADMAGMTLSPEAILARELGICYANIAVITNYVGGISKKPLSHEEVVQMFKKKMKDIKRLILRAIELFDENHKCNVCNLHILMMKNAV